MLPCTSESRVLNQLRSIEALGGAAGFAQWLKETDNGRAFPSIPKEITQGFATGDARAGNSYYTASVSIWFFVAYFTIEVNVIDTPISGDGSAFGFGVGYIAGIGGLEVTGPLERLKDVTTFQVFAGSGGVGTGGVSFYGATGLPIAAIIFAGAGAGGGISGTGGFQFRLAYSV